MNIDQETFTEREKLIASISYTMGHTAALEGVLRAMRESATNAAANGLQGPFIGAVLNGFADSLDAVIQKKPATVDPAPEQVSP